MGKPLIGITTYVVPAKWSYWDLEAALVPAAYVEAVELAGGRALLVPPAENAVAETLDGLDGLVFSGGSDLDPELYGQEAHEETSGIVRRRDDAELALLEGALERDMPVLAICRGSQVLNVARGGDLVQHLPEVVGDAGLMVDPADVDSIAQGMVRLWEDETLRRELSARGLRQAAAFSWEKTARQTLKAYDRA